MALILKRASASRPSGEWGHEATLSVHLLQVGLGLREFGPGSAVGEFNQLRVIAARGGRIPDRSCRSRCARIAA